MGALTVQRFFLTSKEKFVLRLTFLFGLAKVSFMITNLKIHANHAYLFTPARSIFVALSWWDGTYSAQTGEMGDLFADIIGRGPTERDAIANMLSLIEIRIATMANEVLEVETKN